LVAFYQRRARRLLPALLLFLAVMTVYLWGSPGLIGTDLSVLFYVSNWAGIASADGPLAHLWSLAVEEQFYIVWPLALIALTRVMRPSRVLSVVLVAAALSAAIRLTLAAGVPLERLYVGTDSRADALLLGCALAIASHLGWSWRPSRPLVVMAAIALLLCAAPTGAGQAMFAPIELIAGLPVAALAGTILVAYAAGGSPALSLAPLRGFGRISYGLYLWHSPLIILAGWLGFVIAIGIATLSFVFVERPILGRSSGHAAFVMRMNAGAELPAPPAPAST